MSILRSAPFGAKPRARAHREVQGCGAQRRTARSRPEPRAAREACEHGEDGEHGVALYLPSTRANCKTPDESPTTTSGSRHGHGHRYAYGSLPLQIEPLLSGV